MLTLHIDNTEIENIFTEGFHSNKEKFLAFIQNSYIKHESLKTYNEDKKRFMQTYVGMQDGSMEMLDEAIAEEEIETYLETLWE